jgi:hypothetical protein
MIIHIFYVATGILLVGVKQKHLIEVGIDEIVRGNPNCASTAYGCSS